MSSFHCSCVSERFLNACHSVNWEVFITSNLPTKKVLNYIFLSKWIAKPCSLDCAILGWGKSKAFCTSHLADLRKNCLVWVEMCSCRLAESGNSFSRPGASFQPGIGLGFFSIKPIWCFHIAMEVWKELFRVNLILTIRE